MLGISDSLYRHNMVKIEYVVAVLAEHSGFRSLGEGTFVE